MINKLEINALTGEAIVRQLNADELAQYETDKLISITRADAQTARASARADLLAKLGITANEAALLLG